MIESKICQVTQRGSVILLGVELPSGEEVMILIRQIIMLISEILSTTNIINTTMVERPH